MTHRLANKKRIRLRQYALCIGAFVSVWGACSSAGAQYNHLFWFEGFAGVSHLDMKAVNYDGLYPGVVDVSGVGWGGGFAAGVHLLMFDLGARVALSSYTDFDVGTAVLELGVHPSVAFIQPYARLGFGYAWNGQADFDDPVQSEVDVDGVTFEGGLGVDLAVLPWLLIGAGLDFDVLFLSRAAIDSAGMGATTVDPTLAQDGDAIGLQLRGQIHASLRL